MSELGKRTSGEEAAEGEKLYRFAVEWPRKVPANGAGERASRRALSHMYV